MPEVKTNLIIVVCEICGKQGAVNLLRGLSLCNHLTNNWNFGFTHRPSVIGDWRTYCEQCEETSEKIMESQKQERVKFISGDIV